MKIHLSLWAAFLLTFSSSIGSLSAQASATPVPAPTAIPASASAFTITLDVLRTLAAVVSAIGIGVGLQQFLLQRRAWRDTHERARREKAVTVIQDFLQTYSRQWIAVSRLVEKLDPPALQALEKPEPFEIKKELIDLLLAAVPVVTAETIQVPEGPLLKLDQRQAYALHWEAFAFLNAVEIVFEAWHSDVADRSIIQKQMKGLYLPSEGRTLLRGLREATGGAKVFPCIDRFIRDIEPQLIPLPAQPGGPS